MTVRITKTGLVELKGNDDDSVTLMPIDPKLNTVYLSDDCEIAKDVTLGDIFQIVETDILLKMFLKHHSYCPHMDEYHAEALLPRSQDADYDELSYLIVSPYPRLTEDKKRRIWLSYTNWSFYGKKEDSTDKISVSLTPLNEIAHLPVLLETVGRLRLPDGTVPECEVKATLCDVLDAIYNDISFYGSISHKIEFLAGMKKPVEAIEKGEVELHDFDLGDLEDGTEG